MTTLRVLSYNVRSLRDDDAAVGRVIRAARADVVCIQEAPRFLRWRSKCAALARRSGMVVVSGGRAAGANLVLSTLAVAVDATHDIRYSRDAGLEQRGASIAVLRLAGSRFAVAGTHLDLVEAPRLRHVGELHGRLQDLVPTEVPVIVIGDMNDVPGSPVWTALATRGADAFAERGQGDGFTFSATNAVRRIDGVFVDRRIGVVSAAALDNPDIRVASDHRPVLVELDLP